MGNHDDNGPHRPPSGSPPSTPRFPDRLPEASSAAARNRMKATRQRGTKAEQLLCEALDRLGLSYAVDQAPIPGLHRRADVCFVEARVAVFVDGCFWHGCPLHGTSPKANQDWWRAKIDTNRRRDDDTNRTLTDAGWMVLRFWEHEAPDAAAQVVADVVANRTPSGRA